MMKKRFESSSEPERDSVEPTIADALALIEQMPDSDAKKSYLEKIEAFGKACEEAEARWNQLTIEEKEEKLKTALGAIADVQAQILAEKDLPDLVLNELKRDTANSLIKLLQSK